MLATLACLRGYGAVVLTASYNDNGLVHQELVDFDVGEALGGWGSAAATRGDVARCLAPFDRWPEDADAALLTRWRRTSKFALCDPLDASVRCRPCDMVRPGGGGDAWTSAKGRDRCRTTPSDAIGADRACYLTCASTSSAAHANVSITQVLRPDAALCKD